MKSLSLVTLMCLTVIQVSTAFGAMTCEQIFSKIEADLKLQDWINSKRDLQTERTVEIAATEETPNGGKLYTLKLRGKGWNSKYGDFPNAPQGDPRWVFSNFGVPVAEFLGFKMVNSKTMKVPDAIELNHRLDLLDSVLPNDQKIKVRFFNTDVNDPRIGPSKFLELYANSLLIPLATEGTTLVHDISYHLSIIVFPKNVLAQSLKIGRLLLEFNDFAKPKLEAEFGPISKKALTLANRNFIQHLDATTGNFGALLSAHRSGATEAARLVGYSDTAVVRLSNVISSAFVSYMPDAFTAKVQSEIHSSLGAERAADLEVRFKKLLKEFIAQPKILNSEYSQKFNLDYEGFDPEVIANQRSLEGAISKLETVK
jgi:hypothetical protein